MSSESVDGLRKAAKRLLRDAGAGQVQAVRRIEHWFPEVAAGEREPCLADAQLVLARELGFSSWRSLCSGAAAIAENVQALRIAVNEMDVPAVRALLTARPGLARARWPGTEVGFAQNIADRCVWYRPRCRELVLLLAEHGAELDIHSAARAGVLEEVQRLVASDPLLLDRPDAHGRTPLYRASNIYGAFAEAREVAHWLLGQRAAVDLSSACSLVLADHVRRIVETDPQAAGRPDCMGVPPLAWAVRPHRICDEAVAIVKALLDAGADPQGRDPTFKTGMQPLHHLAEWCGAPGQLELLLAAGADVNAHDDNGWTPLDYARDRKRSAFVELLLAHGARPGARGEKA